MDDPLVGKRVRFGSAWSTVKRVDGDKVWAVLEGEGTLVILPRAACTASGIAAVSKRVRAVQRRHIWTETSQRRKQARSPAVCAHAQRERPREHRPQARRTARAASTSRDGPLDPGDEPPLEPDLAQLRGFAAANERLFKHVERRIGSRRVA